MTPAQFAPNLPARRPVLALRATSPPLAPLRAACCALRGPHLDLVAGLQVKGLWALKTDADSVHDAFLVVSFISETRILAMNMEARPASPDGGLSLTACLAPMPHGVSPLCLSSLGASAQRSTHGGPSCCAGRHGMPTPGRPACAVLACLELRTIEAPARQIGRTSWTRRRSLASSASRRRCFAPAWRTRSCCR